jgi:putative peptide zinc metalloprotease protein
MFLYTVLKPYDLQSLGITLMMFSMAGIFFSMFRNVYQIIATPRMEPMSKPKIAFSLAIVGALLWMGFTIRIPWHLEAPFLLEPRGVVTVTSPFSGRILPPEEYRQRIEMLTRVQAFARQKAEDIRKRSDSLENIIIPEAISLLDGLPTPEEYSRPIENGQTIKSRDVLAVVEDHMDIDNRDELIETTYRWVARASELLAHRANSDQVHEYEVRAELAVLEERVRELVRLSATRIVWAPEDGMVVAARRIPEPPRDAVDPTKLDRWSGTPFDVRNLGCVVEIGQELLSLAPSSELQAVLYVDQGDRDDLKEKMEVELKLDHLPSITYVTQVTDVSPRGELVAPEALTTRFDGPLATTSDPQGKEKLASTAYRAIGELYFNHPESQFDGPLMKPGMRGNARFLVDSRTAWQWACRYFLETFRFRV